MKEQGCFNCQFFKPNRCERLDLPTNREDFCLEYQPKTAEDYVRDLRILVTGMTGIDPKVGEIK